MSSSRSDFTIRGRGGAKGQGAAGNGPIHLVVVGVQRAAAATHTGQREEEYVVATVTEQTKKFDIIGIDFLVSVVRNQQEVRHGSSAAGSFDPVRPCSLQSAAP